LYQFLNTKQLRVFNCKFCKIINIFINSYECPSDIHVFGHSRFGHYSIRCFLAFFFRGKCGPPSCSVRFAMILHYMPAQGATCENLMGANVCVRVLTCLFFTAPHRNESFTTARNVDYLIKNSSADCNCAAC